MFKLFLSNLASRENPWLINSALSLSLSLSLPPSLSLEEFSPNFAFDYETNLMLVLTTGPFCFTSTEARWLIRDGDSGGVGGGRWRKSDGSTADTVRKRPERPWTAARTMEVLRRCPLAIAQRLVQCAIAVSATVLGQSHKDNVLTNSSKRRKSNFRSPAPPPYSWSLLG